MPVLLLPAWLQRLVAGTGAILRRSVITRSECHLIIHYVDLSATNSGALGFGSFFSSPSANQRKGKKPKGLGFFNFTNASSSSSDADLAFGAGSVRRKKGKRDDRKGREDGNVNR